ncbi:MAG: aminoglycoside phosphotransferase family protein [Elusimicrobia bacterium]|nr:aminoglycoside phosphotransferase family protein [Elusimicrobiota bacterium]
MTLDTRLEAVAQKFDVAGRLIAVQPVAGGNVNDTYRAVFRTTFSEERIIVQRINRRVFTRPEWIMSNLRRVTDHVHRRLGREAPREDRVWQLPRIVRSRDGRDWVSDGQGGFWRALTLIASTVSHDRAQGPEHAFEAGTVLGQFHRLLSDLDPDLLRDTLPGFHVTPRYLERYDATRKTPGAKRRVKASVEAARLARFVEDRRAFASVLEDARLRGDLKPRLIHGDPKVNNVLLDELTGKGTCIVDLDTVKPGLIHYDFGDALRSIANPAGEEEIDLAKVFFDTTLCEAFVRGYHSRARDFLTPHDRRYLFDSIRLISFELGLRFFEDYLAGDRYFKVRSEGHNLHRARVQFKLCESIEAREPVIRRILESVNGAGPAAPTRNGRPAAAGRSRVSR